MSGKYATCTAILRTFFEVVGDKPVTALESCDYDRYLDVIAVIPPNFRKSPQTKALSVTQVAEMFRHADAPRLSQRSHEKHRMRVVQFIKWLKSRYPSINTSIESIKVGKKQRKSRSRQPFSDEQLKLMFESERALTLLRTPLRAYRIWVPIIGLYTGARLNEICQLSLSDIGEEDGIPCFDINDEGDQKRTKTQSSARRIPIHANLIEIGFLEYVRDLRSSGGLKNNNRVFPELPYSEKSGYGKKPGDWFNNRFLVTLGIKSKQHVFHSFRHTVSSRLRRSQLPSWKISQFIGHESGEKRAEWETTYSTAATARELLEVTAALDFPIDLTAYKQVAILTCPPRPHQPESE